MKILSVVFLLLALVFSSMSSRGQNPSFQWAKKAGGKWGDAGTAIAADKKGFVYYCGHFTDTAAFDEDTLVSAIGGGTEGFIARCSPAGVQSWVKKLGGYGCKLAADHMGNVLISGQFTDSVKIMDSTVYGMGVLDGFIAKLDTLGNLQWVRVIGGTLEDFVYNCSSDASGNLYVTGIFKSEIIIEDTTLLSSSNNYAAFVAKYDTDGHLVWVSQAGGPGIASVSVTAITNDEAGNSYICGNYNGSATLGAPSWGSTTLTGSYNDYIAKLDPSGNWVWAVDVAYNPSCTLTDIKVDKDGNIFSLGYFGYGSNPITVAGQQTINAWGNFSDMYLSKWTNTGTLQWVKTGGSYNAFDQVKTMGVDDSGNVYVAISVYDSVRFGGFTFNCAGSTDIAIVKYNGQGLEQWVTSAGSDTTDEISALAVDTSGNVYATGFYSKSVAFGNFTLAGAGLRGNAFLVKYGHPDEEPEPEGVGEQLQTANGPVVFPNPVMDNLIMKIPRAEKCTISITSVEGTVMLRQDRKIINGSLDINMQELSPGIYFVETSYNRQTFMTKIIKQ